MIASALGRSGETVCPAGGASFSRWGADSAITGIASGLGAPRWQELQLTSCFPSKLLALIANVICIILRAVCFGFLSSLSNAFSTWQYSHCTPSDDVMNC